MNQSSTCIPINHGHPSGPTSRFSCQSGEILHEPKPTYRDLASLRSAHVRSVLYRDVPVPNLCVELRGYEAGHTPEDGAPGDSGFTTDDVAGNRGWGWPDRERPRSIQLQRTNSKDGSFAFVTPESDLVLVLAVYSHGGDYPSAIRSVLHRGGYEVEKWEGAQETMGVGSGRLEMHVRLAGHLEAPEVVWDPPARENDHSPCTRKEVTRTATFTTEGAPTSPSLVAAPPSLLLGRRHSTTSGTEQRSKQDIHDGLPSEPCTAHTSALDCADDLNQTETTRVTPTILLLQSSCWNYGQHGAGLWDMTGVCEMFHSAPETDCALERPSLLPLNAIWMALCEPLVREGATWWAIRVALGLGSLALYGLCACHKDAGLRNTHPWTKSAVDQRGRGGHTDNPADRSSIPTTIGTTRSPNGGISQTGIAVSQVDEPKGLTSTTGRNTRKFRGSVKREEMKTAHIEEVDEFVSMFIALGRPGCVRGQDAKGSSCLGHVVVTK